jgi:hypothetical protein
MSSAFYPLGLRVNNYPNGYISWKSPNNYATISRNIKPFTNKDPTYTDYGAFRRPRPIKHYRKGIIVNNENSSKFTKSSNGMPYLLETIQDTPGSTHSTTPQINNDTCDGLPIIYVNNKIYNDTDTPKYQSDEFCCNKEKDALNRVIYANTGYIPPTYYPSYSQYIHGRGNTYKQKIFNFENISNPILNTYEIPNVYHPPNCPIVSVYKPSNPQFAIQNAVSNGTRILKLSTTTIERSNERAKLFYANYKKQKLYELANL